MRPGPASSTSSDRERERVAFAMKCPEELKAFIDGFLGSVPGAFIVLDKEWRLVYLNSDAVQFFTGNDESLMGRPLEEVYEKRFGHLISPQTIRGLLEGKEKTIDRYSNYFGKWFKISAYSSDSGIFIRLEDITQEKAANRLRTMNQFSVDRAGDMIFWFKPSGHIIYANEASCNALGFTNKGLASMMVADIDPSFTDNKLAVFFEDLKKRGSAVYESSLRSSNRSIIPVEVTYNYLVYYGEEYLIASARDITERKRAVEALKESEERFRTTFEQSAVGMTQVSIDGRFLLVNKKYCDITGYSEDEMLGLTVADITYPADVVAEREMINRLLAGELDTFSSDKRYVRKDRSLIWVKLTVALVRDQGKPIYMTGVTEDITQRKRAEEELRAAKNQADLYLDLMGHDINNLNQIALGYLELAVETVEDDEIRELVMKPIDAIQNSSKLIENVRKLQRAKTGGHKIEAIDVGGLLIELRNQYLNMPGKDVVIDYSPLGECHVMANGLLRDVFSNLIGNAIKHSGSSKSVRIGLELERVGDDGRAYCRVIVEDDGPGIPDMQKEKVFERIRKEDAKASGKGLGLYLVKSLIDDFHGTIHVEDRVKGDHTKGARFVVMMPAVEK